MKSRMKTSGISKLNSLLTIKLGKNGTLALSDMKSIKGGEGEGDGGVIIVMSIPAVRR